MKTGSAKKYMAYVVAFLVIAAIAVAGMMLRHKREAEIANALPMSMAPWAVHAARVVEQPVRSGFLALATVLTSAELTISGQVQGTILDMAHREGEAVKRGEVIARIDTREIDQEILARKAELAAAQSDAANKENEWNREKELLKAGGSTESKVEGWYTELLAAQQRVQAIKREIDGLDVRKSYATVAAPADGVIAARLAEPGDLCSPSHPLYRVTVDHGARVEVSLPQRVLEQTHPGTQVILRHGGEEASVDITRVFPSLDGLALGHAEADLLAPPFGLPSGARIAARVVVDSRAHALVVPHEALLRVHGTKKATVFRIVHKGTSDVLQKKTVMVDLVTPEGAAVVGDLKANDRVVVAHEIVLLSLHDGDTVVTLDQVSVAGGVNQ